MCGHPYLVGSTGRVESIRPANKQCVFVLLQQDFDEIVTLVLERARRERGKTCVVTLRFFTVNSSFEKTFFLSLEEQHVVIHRQVRGILRHIIIKWTISSHDMKTHSAAI